jgi:[NiFe] hydrogenase diaphorase moiety large subunit
MDFFVEESCGWCTPCRAGNIQLRAKLDKIRKGLGTAQDLKDIEDWGKIIKASSRCGLGQTSPQPLLTTLQNFPEVYNKRILKNVDFQPDFDLAAAVSEAAALTGRNVHSEEKPR